MKKIFLVSFLVLIILATSNYVLATTISVTEDNFREHFNKVIGDTQDTLSTMDKNNKTITVTASNTVIKYDFSNNPKFTINLSFTNSMTKEKCVREHDKLYLLATMFSTIGDYYNLDEYSSSGYYIDKFTAQNNGENIITTPDEVSSNYTNAIDFAKQWFDTEVNIKDELFTFTSKKTNESSTNYEVELVLIVNTDVDFTEPVSKYNSTLQNSVIGAGKKALENYENENSAEKEEKALKDAEERINNYKPSQTTASSKQSTSKNSSLPQTGSDIISFITIIILAVISILLSVYNFRNKDIK